MYVKSDVNYKFKGQNKPEVYWFVRRVSTWSITGESPPLIRYRGLDHTHSWITSSSPFSINRRNLESSGVLGPRNSLDSPGIGCKKTRINNIFIKSVDMMYSHGQ